MLELRRSGLGVALGTVLLVLNAFASWNSATPEKTTVGRAREITRRISVLKTGAAQQKAAAAYWLGQQHLAAAQAVDPLVELLGDTSLVDAGQYRSSRVVARMTLGEEAAAALVNIGHPSIEALIRVLKTSPVAEARKNAAWALGALHDTGATGPI